MDYRRFSLSFSDAARGYLARVHGEAQTHEVWRRCSSTRPSGSDEARNQTVEVRNQAGVTGYRKTYADMGEMIPSPLFRMLAENIAMRLGVFLGLPLAPNFIHREHVRGHEELSLVSISPFDRYANLSTFPAGRLSKEAQELLFRVTSALYPFYMWMDIRDLNARGLIARLDEQKNPVALAAIDFEESAIAKWLQVQAEGRKPDFENMNRTPTGLGFDLVRILYCRDTELPSQARFSRDETMRVLEAIETLPRMLIEDAVNAIPPDLLSAAQKKMVCGGLVARQGMLRTMLVDPRLIMPGTGAVQWQEPLALHADDYGLTPLFLEGAEEALLKREDARTEFHAAAKEIAMRIGAGEFDAAADLFSRFHKKEFLQKGEDEERLEAFYDLLAEQKCMVVPYRWNEKGEVVAMAFIHEREIPELKGVLPYINYQITAYEKPQGLSKWLGVCGLAQTMGSVGEKIPELYEALMSSLLEKDIRSPFADEITRRQHAQIPHLPREMSMVLG